MADTKVSALTAASTFVVGAGVAVQDVSTFGGYTSKLYRR